MINCRTYHIQNHKYSCNRISPQEYAKSYAKQMKQSVVEYKLSILIQTEQYLKVAVQHVPESVNGSSGSLHTTYHIVVAWGFLQKCWQTLTN